MATGSRLRVGLLMLSGLLMACERSQVTPAPVASPATPMDPATAGASRPRLVGFSGDGPRLAAPTRQPPAATPRARSARSVPAANVVGPAGGLDDLLWRHGASGENLLWLMSGLTSDGTAPVASQAVGWDVIGVGDFQGIGVRDDILWRDPSTGDIAVWYMDGTAFQSSVALGQVNPDWYIAGLADFDHSGHVDDFVWRNPVSGGVVVWFMNGVSYTGDVNFGTVVPEWRITGIGDFAGTGYPDDFLWRSDGDGTLVGWMMDGLTFLADVAMARIDPEWKIGAVGDWEGTGTVDDILWRGDVSGQLVLWTMNGPGLTSSVYFGSIGTDWSLAGAGSFRSVAPVLGAVPTVLVEGQTAILSGANLAGAQVLVDGVAAVVVGGSASSVEFTVPAFPCRPYRSVLVHVISGADTVQAPSAVQPAALLAPLAVGEGYLDSEPAGTSGLCFQLQPSATNETYLLGVQSISEDVASLTLAQVLGGAGLAAAPAPAVAHDLHRIGAARPPIASALRVSPFPSSQRIAPDATAAARRAAHYRITELNLRMAETLAAGARARVSAPEGARLVAAAAVGDVLPIRVANIDGDVCSDFVTVPAVVRAVGARSIWVEDPANPVGGFDATDFASMSAAFDDKIGATLDAYLNVPTDLDANGRVIVIVTKEVNKRPNVLGFVGSWDLYPASSCGASNYGEVFYGLAPDPSGVYGSAWSLSDVRDEYPALIAHEVTHIVHFARRIYLAPGAPLAFPTAWEMEGLATFAEEVTGHAYTGFAPGQDLGQAAFLASSWYDDMFFDLIFYFGYQASGKVAGAPEQCSWLDRSGNGPCLYSSRMPYGVPASLFRWTMDQYSSPAEEAAKTRALVESPSTGLALLSYLTGDATDEVLSAWAAALYLDGLWLSSGPFTFSSWNLYDVFSYYVSNARPQPYAEASFGGVDRTVFVRGGSTAYFLISSAGRPFVSIGATALPAHMRAWLIRVQ